MQETVKVVGVSPTKGGMGLSTGAAVVTHPLEKNRTALYQIHRGIDISASDDVDGVTDEVQEEASVADAALGTSSGDPKEDMYREAVAAVLRDKRPTTYYVQRGMRIGYNRAASMIERMEREGVITAADHSGKRQIASRESREDAE